MKRLSQSGAVSLFVVIFTTLLIMVIVIGFVKLMVAGQQQATNSDLSQSAYDSAVAGVEDAKRALLFYSLCNTTEPKCADVRDALHDGKCDTLKEAGVVDAPDNGETPIRKVGGANALDQAYTCVTVKMDTDDYKAQLDAGTSRLIPLKGTGTFDTVEVSWFTQEDAGGGAPLGGGGVLPTPTPRPSGSTTLPTASSWGLPTTPALLRFQLIQYGDSFKLSDFDSESASGSDANASTVFLYPTDTGTDINMNAWDLHGGHSPGPAPVKCNTDFSVDIYSCSVKVKLPGVLHGYPDSARQAYLWLGALYNATHVQLKLFRGSTPVKFDGVQPEVDSTGRANDLFRRVKARIELTPAELPYPQAAVDVQNGLCKDYFVTDDPIDYDHCP